MSVVDYSQLTIIVNKPKILTFDLVISGWTFEITTRFFEKAQSCIRHGVG